MVWQKILGILLIVIGAWMVKEFPDAAIFQSSSMTKTGIGLGIILIIAGVVLVFI